VGPINLADVRQALGETDANATNAGALRTILGRGSLNTIQKHLDAIRAERAPAVPVELGAVPAAPAEAIAAVWGAAWAQAQALVLGRLESMTAQRDTLQARAAELAQVLEVSSDALDAKEAELAQVAEAAAAAERAQAETLAALQESNAQLTAELAAATAEVERTRLAAANAATVAERDAQLLTRQHAANTEHLMAQVLELRELLAKHLAPVAKS
jgi:multidrug resistance efflux pump